MNPACLGLQFAFSLKIDDKENYLTFFIFCHSES